MKAGSWPSIILIYLFSVCAGGAIGKIIPLVGVLAQALHVGPDRAAWLISAVLPASVVLAPFGGALSDRLGDRRLTAIGLAVMIAANGAQWLATGYGALLAARLVEGGGFVCLTLGPAAMMMRSTQGARQVAAMSLMSTALPLGVGLSLALAGQAPGARWQLVPLAHGLVLAALLPLLRLAPAGSGAPAPGTPPPLRWTELLRAPAPRRLAAGVLSASAIMFGLGALYPTYAVAHFGIAPATAAAYGLVTYPASVIGSFMAGALARRHGLGRLGTGGLVALALAGVAVFWPALGLVPSVLLLVGFYLLAGLVGAVGMARLPAVVPSPAAVGITTGLYIQGANAGTMLGAPLLFAAYYGGAFPAVALAILACVALTLACWRFPAPSHR